MEIQLFTPHLAQKRVIDGFSESHHKYGVFVACRQIGKSLLAQNMMLYWLLKQPDQKGGWIAPTYDQCLEPFKELSKAAESIIINTNKAELIIYFINGSTLKFKSADRPDGIRGYKFHYLIVDEAAFISNIAMEGCISSTQDAIGKKCLIISTPMSKNWFYEWYLIGTDGNSDEIISFKSNIYENPFIDEKTIEFKKLNMSQAMFRTECLAEFNDSSNDIFTNLDNVCILHEFSRNSTLQLFFGIDIALKKDYTVVTVIDKLGKVIDILRFTGGEIVPAAEKIEKFLNQYKITGGYCETNNVGIAIYENLKHKINGIKPFITTQTSKEKAVNMLVINMENNELELPSRDLFPQLYNEMSAWTYSQTPNGKTSYKHPSGFHDDCVDSLWLANYARNTIVTANRIYINGKYI